MLDKKTVRRMWEMMREQYKTYGRFNYKTIAREVNINQHTVAKYGRVLYNQISRIEMANEKTKLSKENPLVELIKDLKANVIKERENG